MSFVKPHNTPRGRSHVCGKPPRARFRAFYRACNNLAPIRLCATIVISLGMLCFASWTMNNNATQRIHIYEIGRYVTQFHSPPILDSWSRITQAWRAEQHRDDELRSRIDKSLGAEKMIHVRNHQRFVLDMVDDYALQDDIENVLYFFERVTLCVRTRGCDPRDAARRFGTPLHQFHDRLSYYFELEGSETDAAAMLSVILLP